MKIIGCSHDDFVPLPSPIDHRCILPPTYFNSHILQCMPTSSLWFALFTASNRTKGGSSKNERNKQQTQQILNRAEKGTNGMTDDAVMRKAVTHWIVIAMCLLFIMWSKFLCLMYSVNPECFWCSIIFWGDKLVCCVTQKDWNKQKQFWDWHV